MASDVKANIAGHIKSNAAMYLIALFSLIVGLTAGSLSALRLSEPQTKGMSDFIAMFLEASKSENVNVWKVILQSFINNMQILVLVGGLGLFMIGLPFIILMIAAKGLIIGFSMGILCNILGLKGLLIFILCIIPANLILLPAFTYGSVLALNNSMFRFRSRGGASSNNIQQSSYYRQFIIVIIVSLLGVLVEGLLQPVLVRFFV